MNKMPVNEQHRVLSRLFMHHMRIPNFVVNVSCHSSYLSAAGYAQLSGQLLPVSPSSVRCNQAFYLLNSMHTA